MLLLFLCLSEKLKKVTEDASQELVGLSEHYVNVIIPKRLQTEEKHLDEVKQPAPDYETDDTNSITTSSSRIIVPEHIALTHLKELGYFRGA